MSVIKLKNWSGQLLYTTTARETSKVSDYLIPRILRAVLRSGNEKNADAWKEAFNTSSDANLIALASRVVGIFFPSGSTARYFKQSTTVHDLAVKLFPASYTENYDATAAALVIVARMGLMAYDSGYTSTNPVNGSEDNKALTIHQLMGIAEGIRFMTEVYAPKLDVCVQRCNTVINLNKHAGEGTMPAWVGNIVPRSVENLLTDFNEQIEHYLNNYTTKASFNTSRHVDQLRRMAASYMLASSDWEDNYSNLNIKDTILHVENLFDDFFKKGTDSDGKEVISFPEKSDLEAVLAAVQFHQGGTLAAIHSLENGIADKATPMLKTTGEEYISRVTPFNRVTTEGVTIPMFDAHTPTANSLVCLADVEGGYSGAYGFKYYMDNTVTAAVSTFVHDHIDFLVKLYDNLKARFVACGAACADEHTLDSTTAAALQNIPVAYVIDAATDGLDNMPIIGEDYSYLKGTYTDLVHSSLSFFGFTQVDTCFQYRSVDEAYRAMLIVRSFAQIEDDPWYGIDIVDAKAKSEKQYVSSYRTFLDNKNIIKVINPNDASCSAQVFCPNTDTSAPVALYEFACRYGVERPRTFVEEGHLKTWLAQFSDALKSLWALASVQEGFDISDIVRDALREHIKSCRTKYGDRCKSLVKKQFTKSALSDGSLTFGQSIIRAVNRSAMSIDQALMRLICPDLSVLWAWVKAQAIVEATNSDSDYLLVE